MTAPSPEIDPTAGLFLPAPRGPAVPLRYRSGRLTSWDLLTGENTVVIDGESFSDLPILPGTYLATLTVGDTLALISTTDENGISTYAIMGAAITPPDPRIPRGSGAMGYSKYVSGIGTFSTSTVSVSYVPIGHTPEVEMFKINQESRVDVDITGTCHGSGGASAVAFGVLVDGATYVDLVRINLNNSLANSHTPFAGGSLITLAGAGERTFQPVWAYLGGGNAIAMDASDQLTMTVREVM